ncbi:unnamed protein product, partial [Staurois parvus]
NDRSQAPRRGRRAPSHQAQTVGLRVNWYDRGHWVRHWIVWLDSGHWSPGIRSFGSTAGTASSGKAVGSESTGTTVSTGSFGSTAGTGSGTGSSGSTAGIESTGLIGSSGWIIHHAG